MSDHFISGSEMITKVFNNISSGAAEKANKILEDEAS